MKLDNTLLVLMVVTALPMPTLLLGESIARRKPNSKFTAWWRKHVVENEK